jgi:hypothetical protein
VEEDLINWNFSINFGNIQPKASNQSSTFYIGAKQPCQIKFEAMIFANNLPDPIILPFSINIETEIKSLDVKKIIDLN